MLDGVGEIADLTATIEALPCNVRLPPSWGAGPAGTEVFASGPRDRCGFLRRSLRGLAALEYHSTLPGLDRAPACFRVYTLDISRNGVSFLHGEQLFPAERMRLLLADGRWLGVEIVRCRKIQDGCFEVAASVLAQG
jgi:hypothetical protein